MPSQCSLVNTKLSNYFETQSLACLHQLKWWKILLQEMAWWQDLPAPQINITLKKKDHNKLKAMQQCNLHWWFSHQEPVWMGLPSQTRQDFNRLIHHMLTVLFKNLSHQIQLTVKSAELHNVQWLPCKMSPRSTVIPKNLWNAPSATSEMWDGMKTRHKTIWGLQLPIILFLNWVCCTLTMKEITTKEQLNVLASLSIYHWSAIFSLNCNRAKLTTGFLYWSALNVITHSTFNLKLRLMWLP